ncbi:MAP/microtubule affinity-regulating kinase [Paragonimus westermani]|uniref:non-specific serine/threonine protein kinase n=1 Tax=Paragonimus westermani TaxID=34504 RepID=A0A5J4NYB6_9TREM|nr:MAP/microtubule affinity-regulating kinase [Paragonimus westermani]
MVILTTTSGMVKTIMAMDTMRPNPDNLNQMLEPFVCTLDRSRTPSQIPSKEVRTVRIQKPFSRLTPISNTNTTTITTTTATTITTVPINGHQVMNKAFEPKPPGTRQRRPRSRNIAIPTSPPIQTKKAENFGSINPSRVGKYSIIRTLGRGNFAQVKLAVHMTTGREVAIKMIDKTTLNENCRIKLSREIRVLKSLIHPNIVRLYEVIETTRNVYLVMEYAKNGEVFDHLMKHGRMDEKQARSIFRQLFSAVEYCHQKNIVHRDLKVR